ncbi:MAG: class I SAM-dependent methyltransferase [Bacteroidota bacterium]
MPTIEQNLNIWNNPDWSAFKDGEDWSVSFGGTAALWQNIIEPRIKPFLSLHNTCVEIACGHGRITDILKDRFKEIHALDVSPNCIDFCKNRFAEINNIIYHVNNGYTLPIEDVSSDFVFSWDSLVHCEIDVVKSYIHDSYRILRPGGVCFLHVSNFGEHMGKPNHHMRAESVSADAVTDICTSAGFVIESLERVKWGEEFENDIFLTVYKP